MFENVHSEYQNNMDSRILSVTTILCLLLTLTTGRHIISQAPTRTKSRIYQFGRRHIPIATTNRMWNYTHTPQYARAAIARYNLRLQDKNSLNNAQDVYQNRRAQHSQFSSNTMNDNLSIPVRTRNNRPFSRRRLSEVILPRTYKNVALNDDTRQVSRRRFSLHLLQKQRNGRRQVHRVTVNTNRGRNIQIVHNSRHAKFIVNTRGHSARLRIYKSNERRGARVVQHVEGRSMPRDSEYGLQSSNRNEAGTKYQVISSMHADKSNALTANTHVIAEEKTIPISHIKLRPTEPSGSNKDISTVTIFDSDRNDIKYSSSAPVHTTIANPSHGTEPIVRSTRLVGTSRTTNVPSKTTSFAASTISKPRTNDTTAVSSGITQDDTTAVSKGITQDGEDLPDLPDIPDFIHIPDSD